MFFLLTLNITKIIYNFEKIDTQNYLFNQMFKRYIIKMKKQRPPKNV